MTKTSMARKIVLILVVVLVLQLFIGAVANAAPSENGSCFYYTVRWGDTLSSIALRYGDTVAGLASRNGLANPNYIYAGQVLYVCGYCAPVPPPPPGCSVTHVVQWGETLTSIAYTYGTTPWTIASRNGIYNMNLIYAGQVLCIW